MTWTIRAVAFDDDRARSLRGAQRRELDARYGRDDHEPGVPPSADDMSVFLLARHGDGSAIACGGLRPVKNACARADVVEIKRMYVVPSARGTGIATAVLRELEDQARRLGSTRIVLETGTRQPDAIRFYEREGYTSIPLFGDYIGSADSVCFALSL